MVKATNVKRKAHTPTDIKTHRKWQKTVRRTTTIKITNKWLTMVKSCQILKEFRMPYN